MHLITMSYTLLTYTAYTFCTVLDTFLQLDLIVTL